MILAIPIIIGLLLYAFRRYRALQLRRQMRSCIRSFTVHVKEASREEFAWPTELSESWKSRR